MSSPADPVNNAVSILLPIAFDVSGINAELFGQLVELSGIILPIQIVLPATHFYDGSNSYIYYRQDISENIFSTDISRTYAAIIAQDISASLGLWEGATYDVTKRGINHIDASNAFPGISEPFKYYNSMQDFVLSYFAFKILGHPGALAAISNDSTIRDQTSALLNTDTITYKLSSASKDEGSLTDDDVKAIVQQVINQDLSRFDKVDKRIDGYTPLAMYAGDRVYLQVRMYGNSYSLHSPASNPTTVSTGLVSAASATAGLPTQISYATYDTYLLEFLLG
jgi:hypothetical protein